MFKTISIICGFVFASIPAVAKQTVDQGSRLYQQHCVVCHGANGKGKGPGAAGLAQPPADHTDKDRLAKISDDTLFDIIAVGGKFFNRSAEMPAFQSQLNPVQIRSLVKKIRSLCRCQEPEWARDNR